MDESGMLLGVNSKIFFLLFMSLFILPTAYCLLPTASAYPLHAGFPVQISGRLENSVVVADVDGDRTMELCFSIGGKTYLLNSNGGTYNKAWPVNSGYRTPAIADFDLDGLKEIVTVGPGLTMNVVRIDGSPIPGWPHSFQNAGPRDNVAILDLDGNSYVDVVVGFGASVNYFSILDNHGSDIQGYPIGMEDDLYYHPGIADLDNNGRYEVIIGFWDYGHKRLIAHDLSGNIFQGNWTVDLEGLGLGGLRSSITVADIDGDKRPEIMFATDVSDILPHDIHAVVLNHDRTFATGWPKVIHSWIYGGLSAGDIDGDGKLEVAGVTGGNYDDSNSFFSRLYVWNGEDGSDVPGFPKDIIGGADDCIGQGVLIGDIDGDGDRELIFACYDQLTNNTGLYAFHHTGEIVSGFPLMINGYDILWNNNAFIADMDDDGLVEIGIGVNNDGSLSRIYVWDLPYPYKAEFQDWPQFRHDAQHTGNYHFPEGLPIFRPVPAMGWPGLLLLALLMGLAIRRHTAYDAGRRRNVQ